MKSKKLLTITLTSLLIGSCLVLPALADSADAPSGGNVATYEISANVKRIDEYAFANSTSLVILFPIKNAPNPLPTSNTDDCIF